MTHDKVIDTNTGMNVCAAGPNTVTNNSYEVLCWLKFGISVDKLSVTHKIDKDCEILIITAHYGERKGYYIV